MLKKRLRIVGQGHRISAIILVSILLFQIISSLIPLDINVQGISYSGTVTKFEGSFTNVSIFYYRENSTDYTTIAVPSDSVITNVTFYLTGAEFEGENPSNISLLFDYDNKRIWNHSGPITSQDYIQVTSIHSEMNAYIESIDRQESTVEVPLIFLSESKGNLTLYNLTVLWSRSDYSINSASCPDVVSIGEIFNISITVENNGNHNVYYLGISAYIDTQQKQNEIGIRCVNITHNDTYISSFSADSLFISEGVHDLIIAINPYNTSPEMNYNNNIYIIDDVEFLPLDENQTANRQYNFQFKDVSFPSIFEFNSQGYINLTVVNYGWDDALDVGIKVKDNGTDFFSQYYNLSGFRSNPQMVIISIDSLSLGMHNFSFYLDPDNDFIEENEDGNNITNQYISCILCSDVWLHTLSTDTGNWTSHDETETYSTIAGSIEGRHFFNSSMHLSDQQRYYSLISPVVDLSSFTDNTPGLDFYLNFSTYYNFDVTQTGHIEIVINGQGSQIGPTFEGDSNNLWIDVSIDISNYYDKNFTVEFISDSDFITSTDYYWLIDIITINNCNFIETAEVGDGHSFGYDEVIDWNLEAWDIQEAYTGYGDYWDIVEHESILYWDNPLEPNLENSIKSDPIYMPLMDAPYPSDPYEASISFACDYNFGETTDKTTFKIVSADNPNQHLILDIFTGQRSQEQSGNLFIDFPSSFTGIRSYFEFVVETDSNPFPEGKFGIGDFRILLQPVDDDGGSNLLSCRSAIHTYINYNEDWTVDTKRTYAGQQQFPELTVTLTRKSEPSYSFSKETSQVQFALNWDFIENPTTQRWYDSVSYTLDVDWCRGSYIVREECEQDGTFGISMLDEIEFQSDRDHPQYTSSPEMLKYIIINRDAWDYYQATDLYIRFTVMAYRDVHDEAKDDLPFAWESDYSQSDTESIEISIGVRFENYDTTWDTMIRLKGGDNVIGGYEVKPPFTGEYNMLGSNSGTIYRLGESSCIQINFKVRYKVDEWNWQRNDVYFWWEIWKDKNKDKQISPNNPNNDERIYHGEWWWEDEWADPQWNDWTTKTISLGFGSASDGWYIIRCRCLCTEEDWVDGGNADSWPEVEDWVGRTISLIIIEG